MTAPAPFEWWYDDFAAETIGPGTNDVEGLEREARPLASDDEGGDDEIARASEELEEDAG